MYLRNITLFSNRNQQINKYLDKENYITDITFGNDQN